MDRGCRFRVTPLILGLAASLAGCVPEDGLGPQFVTLEVVSGTNQTGYVGATLLDPLVIRARDEKGEPTPGVRVSWSVLTGGGDIATATTETNDQGEAEASFRLGNVLGPQAAQAFAYETDALPVRFDATATPAPASTLTLVSGGGQSGTVGTVLPQEISIRLNDAFGNIVPGTTVSFVVTSGGGTTSVPSAVSDNAGMVRFRWTLGPDAGTQAVTAVIFGVNPLVIEATARAASPSQIVVQSGAGQSALPGSQLPEPLVARVEDQFGNPIPNVMVTWTPVGSSAGSVSPAISPSNLQGEASTTWTLGPSGGGKEVRASASGISAPATFSGAGQIVFRVVSAGRFHSCGVDQAGIGYCWGLYGDGQLGMGPAPGGSGAALNAPHSVAQGSIIFAIGVRSSTAGGAHSCAVVANSDAWCWGKNSDGRLGNGSTLSSTTPVRVSGTGYQTVSAGAFHTCARTTGDRIYCWGLNSEGQVGVSGTTASPSPVMEAKTFVSVAAGGLHSCAIATGGTAWCWGSNAKDQLGVSGTGGSTPVQVESELLFASIVTGDSHTCALTADGTAYCWGDNEAGQLGVEPELVATREEPEPAAPGFTFTSLTAGLDHTCGLTQAGLAFCWGRNSSGELGDNTAMDSAAPVAVGGGHTFESISAGDRHTCGVTSDHIAYCWGSNQFGQLGGSQTALFLTLPAKVAYQP